MRRQVKYLMLQLLILSTGNIYAQLQGQGLIDSLLKSLPRQREDTIKVKVLEDLSFQYCFINTVEGIKYGEQSLELATKLGWDKGMGGAYNSIATNYAIKADYPRALGYYIKALKLYEQYGDKQGSAALTCNIGNIYHYRSDYPKALAYYFKALKLYEGLGNKQGIANNLGNIGMVYNYLGDYQNALEYYFKALNLFEELGDKQGLASNTGNIGSVYKSRKDYAKALEYHLKSLKLQEELGDKSGIATSVGNIGNVYQEQGNYLSAIEYMQRALKLYEELGDKNGAANNLSNIGSVYISIVKNPTTAIVMDAGELPFNEGHSQVVIPKGKESLLAAAIDNQLRSIVINREINAVNLLKNCYEQLSEAYRLKGDYKKALDYSDSLIVLKDSIFSQENKDKITEQENKRREYGDSLTAVAAQNAVAAKMAHRSNYELIGAGVLALALCFIFVVTRKNKLLDKEKKKSDNLLLNILPEEVAGQLKDTGAAAARNFDNVTVLFTDFVNFTEASGRMKPEALIAELDTCFKKFDAITGKHKIEKIKTIGDAYLAVCGLPHPNPEHAVNIIKAAQEINAFMQDREAKVGNSTFKIRIGVHTGSVIAGIVGDKKFAYDIWGDTVNTAARMEQNSDACKINISQATYDLVKDKIDCAYRGEIDVKGKGSMKMYFVG